MCLFQKELGFDQYVDEVAQVYDKHKTEQAVLLFCVLPFCTYLISLQDKPSFCKKLENSGMSTEDLLREQQRLFASAKEKAGSAAPTPLTPVMPIAAVAPAAAAAVPRAAPVVAVRPLPTPTATVAAVAPVVAAAMPVASASAPPAVAPAPAPASDAAADAQAPGSEQTS